MNIKRATYIGIVLGLFIMVCSMTACNSRMSTCDARGSGNSVKMKKNRSNYGAMYDYKAKPVGKNYVIRNGR